jgi:hypothetical protein
MALEGIVVIICQQEIPGSLIITYLQVKLGDKEEEK